MKYRYLHAFCFLFLFLGIKTSYAQDFRLIGKKDSYTTNFKLINNLIVLPLEINGSKLTFILDSGVKTPVIFNLTSSDSLEVKDVEKIFIRGLGEGEPIEALYSRGNRFRLGNVYGPNENLYIVHDNDLEFSSKFGFPVHGLIGYNLLKDFVVTLDYIGKRITFTKPNKYRYRRCRKCETFDLEFHRGKPYIQGRVKVIEPMDKEMDVKLLIDSGSSDSVWLFEDKNISIPDNSFRDFVGQGLSGDIFGMRSKLKSFSLKSFVFNKSNVAYLDSLSTLYAKRFKSRNGSIGGNILKRFRVTFDYPNNKLTLRKNRNFNEKFGYNLSGIQLMHFGKELVLHRNNAAFTVSKDDETTESNTMSFGYDYKYSLKPVYKIYHVRENSPAQAVGIRKDDVIVKVNGVYVYNYNLQELNRKFYGGDNKKVRVMVNRNGLELTFDLVLRDIL